MLRSVLLCIIMTTTISGCSAIAPLAKDALLGGAKKGIETRVSMSKGDAEGESSVAQNASTAILVDTGMEGTYEGPVGTVVNEGEIPIHLLIILILLAGWAIPSPSEMGHGLVRIVRILGGKPSPR